MRQDMVERRLNMFDNDFCATVRGNAGNASDLVFDVARFFGGCYEVTAALYLSVLENSVI